jgi:hypothetical protein
MEGVQQEAGAARPGAHDAPDAVAAHDTIDTAVAHAAKAAATAAPKRPKSVADIVKLVLEKAAAEEGSPQGGSAGDGSQKAAEAEGEEGAIAHGTHLATGNMHVHDRMSARCGGRRPKRTRRRTCASLSPNSCLFVR